MTTADYALIVSIFSAAISIAGFAWNVWSKFIFPKARIHVQLRFMYEMRFDGTEGQSFIEVNATNFGPGDVVLDRVILRSRANRLQKGRYGIMNTSARFDTVDDNASMTFNSGKIGVGDRFSR